MAKNGRSNNDPLFSRKEAADYLGINVRTLANWKCNKRYSLPTTKIGRLVKYKQSDLEAFIQEGSGSH